MGVEILSPLPKLLLHHPYRTIILNALTNALNEVAGDQAIERSLQVEADKLIVQGEGYKLDPQGKLILMAAGKAAAAMMQAALQKFGNRVDRAIAITKKEVSLSLPRLEIVYGDHPVPGKKSIHASHQLELFMRDFTSRDTVICLISGGASALLTYPRPPLTLRQLQQTTRHLLKCGATIQEINCIRKHLEKFKGGGLAAQAQPARVISLILSDVIGDDLSSIASGMTAPDPTTYGDALDIIHHYKLDKQIPLSVLQMLQNGHTGLIPETMKAHDPLFQNVKNHLIGSNIQACHALWQTFQQNGFTTLHLTSYLQGEASQVGRVFAAFARQLAKTPARFKPVCWIAGGETTVTLHGKGTGGRNLELALGAVKDLAGLDNILLITLATDGEDGFSPAAGAVVDGRSWRRAIDIGLNPDQFLANNDSYSFFKALGDLIYTSPTNTNVNDLLLLLAY